MNIPEHGWALLDHPESFLADRRGVVGALQCGKEVREFALKAMDLIAKLEAQLEQIEEERPRWTEEELAKAKERGERLFRRFEGSAANELLKAQVAELEARAGVPAPCPKCKRHTVVVSSGGTHLRCIICEWFQTERYTTAEDAYKAHAKGSTG